MKTFIVEASETVYYQWEIKAETEEEALAKVHDGKVPFEPVDGTGFQIDEVIEHKGE